MIKIEMQVIPKPKDREAAIFTKTPNFTMEHPYATMHGDGDTNYLCGCCRTAIVIGASVGQIKGITFKCSKCGSYNILQGSTL